MRQEVEDPIPCYIVSNLVQLKASPLLMPVKKSTGRVRENEKEGNKEEGVVRKQSGRYIS
jgi:hypothetical protein